MTPHHPADDRIEAARDRPVRARQATSGTMPRPAHHALLVLQRSYGNGAVARLLGVQSSSHPGPLTSPSDAARPTVQRDVGFEFQMLDSHVDLYKKGKTLLPGVTMAWGSQDWTVEKDGEKNIEFVTRPFADADSARKSVAQIAAVGALAATKGYKFMAQKPRSQTNAMKVIETDTRGQPQANVDVSPDSLATGDLRFNDGGDARNKEYFGATGVFQWSYGRTKTLMNRVERIRSEMAKYSSEDILDHIQKELGYDSYLAVDAVPSLAKLERLIRAYCIIEASMLELGGKGLTKDLPILPKVNMTSIEDEIANLLRSGLLTSNAQSLRPKVAISLRREPFADIIADLRSSTGSGRGREQDVWETGPGSRARSLYGLKAPKDVASRREYSLLLEYRRIPVMPVTAWADFAHKAVTDLLPLQRDATDDVGRVVTRA